MSFIFLEKIGVYWYGKPLGYKFNETPCVDLQQPVCGFVSVLVPTTIRVSQLDYEDYNIGLDVCLGK